MTAVRPAAAGPNPAAAPPDIDALREAASRCGLSLYEDPYGAQSRVSGADDAMRDATRDATGDAARDAMRTKLAAGAVALLPGQAILAASGDDVVRFLHSQTTNDVEHQAPGEARWHGYCSPKGRLLATMLAWRDGDSMHLALPDAIAEPVRKRLTMFVLRAKVRFANETGSLAVLGLCGARVPAALSSIGLDAPQPMAVSRGAEGTVVGLETISIDAAGSSKSPESSVSTQADASLRRWLLIVPVSALESVWNALSRSLAPVDSVAWRWTVVRAAIAPIVGATSEQFVPQMVNFEATGGVSFTKGCYPGQEVVARSHYLGKLKRRTFLGRLPPGSPEPPPGADVTDGRNEPVGQVVAAAPSPDDAIELLYEARVDAARSGVLSVAGSPIESLALPYPLPSE